MDNNPLVCNPEEKALTVLQKMIEQRKTYSLIKLWDELQGIVTYKDFLFLLEEREPPTLPAYIVGLPEDSFEAELAKSKFFKKANALHASYPKIQEIRSTIKTKEITDYKRRYEVNATVIMGGKIYNYSKNGWDLPSIFDSISNKLKKLLTKKRVKKHERIV
jgi:ribosome-associated translation inhibitor RaiA